MGGTTGNPTCVVAEENVLMSAANKGHESESILVHEFAHSVMDIGFDAVQNVRSQPRYLCTC
jgi:hypothetical protein